MGTERRASNDRRTGSDRRQTENGPPINYERRRAVEARQPELTELHLSEEELKELGFLQPDTAPKSPRSPAPAGKRESHGTDAP